MNRCLTLLAAAVLFLLAGCEINDYTSAEAPNQLTLDKASRNFTVHFAPGSPVLARGEIERIDRMVASGEIGERDRVTVSPSGPPALATARTDALNSVMLRHGLTVEQTVIADVPRDAAIVEIGRYLVTLPPCPNWSKPPSADFTNMRASNFGCSTASNLGEMVASPADFAEGRPLGLAAGMPAAAAVNRYNNDKVVLPTPNSALPIAAVQNAAPGPSTP